uniref:Uncharacterized protein n=1 Tax=Euplotes harpa TaxID=151035 RepID=A0A7S3J857_9SPIT|mmetsp:Transcript_25198/g.29042  ORF Transcript_25198/g.29042 Transcript_25198/m.29042 type:complete len:283 (+) Transcript_25198:955-1803(+)
MRENNCVLKGKRIDIKRAEPKENSVPRQQMNNNSRRDYNYNNMQMDSGRGMNYRNQYQDNYRSGGGDGGGGGGGYQRNYPPRERGPPQYMHSKQEPYPPQQMMYQDYQMPYQQIEPPNVATIAPYAPPAQPTPSSYKYYNQQSPQSGYKQPGYGGGQYMDKVNDSRVMNEPKMMRRDDMYGNPGYSRGQGKDMGYEKQGYDKPVYDKPVYDKPVYDKPVYDKPVYEKPGYGSQNSGKPSYDTGMGYGQQAYQQYPKPHSNEQYMGGPSSREYPSSKNRYKPY